MPGGVDEVDRSTEVRYQRDVVGVMGREMGTAGGSEWASGGTLFRACVVGVGRRNGVISTARRMQGLSVLVVRESFVNHCR